MTANELADWIENGAPFGDYETAKQAATMLRKQQAEIERLIMLCDCMTTESNRKGNEIEALKLRELTDEEIIEIASPMFVDVRYPSTALEFARAILKKAREK